MVGVIIYRVNYRYGNTVNFILEEMQGRNRNNPNIESTSDENTGVEKFYLSIGTME